MGNAAVVVKVTENGTFVFTVVDFSQFGLEEVEFGIRRDTAKRLHKELGALLKQTEPDR